MRTLQIYQFLLLPAVVLVLSACRSITPGNQLPALEASPTLIPVPTGFYGGIAWIDDWIVAALDTTVEPKAFTGRIWRFHPDGSQAEQVMLPEVSGCDRQGFYAPARLPDQRLGYIVTCFRQRGVALADLMLMAYNMQTQQTTPLLSYPLPSQVFGTGGYSWNPTMTRGITSDGNSLYERLYWLDPTQPVTLDVGLPQAFAATWSPNGAQIAFLGAPAQGREGMARIDSYFYLYLMQPDGTQIQPLVRDWYHVASMAWSPDGRWIVLPASRRVDDADEGLWLIDVQTGTYRRIASGTYAAPTWSPDGTQLAVLFYPSKEPNAQARIARFDMAPLLAAP